jgi:hypothetical protein
MVRQRNSPSAYVVVEEKEKKVRKTKPGIIYKLRQVPNLVSESAIVFRYTEVLDDTILCTLSTTYYNI